MTGRFRDAVSIGWCRIGSSTSRGRVPSSRSSSTPGGASDLGRQRCDALGSWRPLGSLPMTFVKILAPLTGGSRDIAVLASAFAAAKPFNAHVAALFVRPDSMEAVPFYGESVSTAVMQEIAQASQKASDLAAKTA